MNAISQSNFLQALGWAVLNSLWQMALLWVLYQFITGLFKNSSSHKSLLATSLLFTGFGWFIFSFVSIYYNETASNPVAAAGFSAVEGNSRLNQFLQTWLPVASIGYLVMLLLPVWRYIRNYRYVQVIRKTGLSKANIEWRMFVRRVAAQMGIKKPVHIWLSDLVTSPVTIGYLKPIILVPVAAVNNLSSEQAEAILLHELAHIRRYDYFVNLLIRLIQSVLYFNPFVKAFVRIIEREREKSCDEMVMQYQYDPHGYATALLVLEKANHQPKPFAVAAAGKKNDLLHRIEWIMGVQQQKTFSFQKLAGVLAGLLCIFGLNAVVVLSHSKKADKQDATLRSSLATIASPMYFFADHNNEAEATPAATDLHENPAVIKEDKDESLAKTVSEFATEIKNAVPVKMVAHDVPVIVQEAVNHLKDNPHFKYVSLFETLPDPVLTKYEEAQVKKAIADTRKVLEESQWKEVEKSFAEVFTQQQKDQLRAEYMKEVNKLNLKKWEDKLRTAYDKVNWERVNYQLSAAVNNIRLDSLQHVYSKAMGDLAKIQTELELNEITAIPDSDVSIQLVEQKKQEVQKTLDKLKAVKARKVVRL